MKQENINPITTLYQMCQSKFGKTPTKNIECSSGENKNTHVTVSLITPIGLFVAGGATKREAHTEVCRVALTHMV
jgi:hypothetical protein